MPDDMNINEGSMPTKTGNLPKPYNKIKDVPFQLIKDAVHSSKNITQASKILATSTGFTDRGIRYAIFKMEVQGVLSPTEFAQPNPRHIETVNRARAKKLGEIEKIKKRAEPKRVEGDFVMVTVHMRAESQDLGGHGAHPINLEASYSRIIHKNPSRYEIEAMIDELRQRIFDTPNYKNLWRVLGNDEEYMFDMMNGVEIEELSSTHHTDGEINIPLRPKRSR